MGRCGDKKKEGNCEGSICFTWRWLKVLLARLFQKVPKLDAVTHPRPQHQYLLIQWAELHTVELHIELHIIMILIRHSNTCLSFSVWEVANEWMWSLRQCSTLYSMYEFHGECAPAPPALLLPLQIWFIVFHHQHKTCLLYKTWKLLTLLWRCLSVCFKNNALQTGIYWANEMPSGRLWWAIKRKGTVR